VLAIGGSVICVVYQCIKLIIMAYRRLPFDWVYLSFDHFLLTASTYGDIPDVQVLTEVVSDF
jgi:hypothetical protein